MMHAVVIWWPTVDMATGGRCAIDAIICEKPPMGWGGRIHLLKPECHLSLSAHQHGQSGLEAEDGLQ